jgi:hypothetical protein
LGTCLRTCKFFEEQKESALNKESLGFLLFLGWRRNH